MRAREATRALRHKQSARCDEVVMDGEVRQCIYSQVARSTCPSFKLSASLTQARKSELWKESPPPGHLPQTQKRGNEPWEV